MISTPPPQIRFLVMATVLVLAVILPTQTDMGEGEPLYQMAGLPNSLLSSPELLRSENMLIVYAHANGIIENRDIRR